jgi:hypothetical protein
VDLIDKLVEHGEPVWIGCVHDADSAGTLIYETLQNETRARGARKIQIVNLGLDPWEAEAMGLVSERFEKKSQDLRPVAQYVLDHPDGEHWKEWLQSNRYELNAMSTPQFLSWLTGKVTASGIGKVVPPDAVMVVERRQKIERLVKARLAERILREANLDGQVRAAIAGLRLPTLERAAVAAWVSAYQTASWRDFVDNQVETTASEI